MILRKSMKGELPLQAAATKAFEALMTPSFEERDEAQPFARERALVNNLKTLFLILSGAAVQKFQLRLQDEQEVLMAAADLAIQIFALESAALRAEKIYPAASDRKKDLLQAALKAFAFNAAEEASKAARKCAFYVEEGDALTMLLSGARRFTRYDATGLLQARRTLAEEVLERPGYLF